MLKETLALKDFPELTQLEAKNNKLTVVDVQGAPKIEKLYLVRPCGNTSLHGGLRLTPCLFDMRLVGQ